MGAEMTSAERLLEPIQSLHVAIRDAVVDACARQATEQLAATAGDAGDTIYAIDRVGEEALVRGLATVVRFFPGAREILGAIDDEVAHALVQPEPGRAACFEDQYACTGGELYELMAGHDRFVADLRPLVKPGTLCCHPYDLCTMLIGAEAGVIVTDPAGRLVDAPRDLNNH